MPELPEVETTRLGLVKNLIEQVISHVEVCDGRNLRRQSPEEFQHLCQDKQIVSITRRGKFLIFHLEPEGYVIVHLRMTGQMLYGDKDPQAKLIFHLENNENVLNFVDQRVFGEVSFVHHLEDHKPLQKLGPEPLDDAFTLNDFQKRLKRKTAIKALLLNQEIMVGMGNIYVTEALFEAGIHPLQPSDTISKEKSKRLYHAMRAILTKAIELGGSSIRNYVNVSGTSGAFQRTYKVYGRQGQPCQTCETSLENVKVVQRSSVFCPECQALRENDRILG